MSIPEGAVAVGSKLYLFKSDTNSVDCIISAHGGYVSANRSFTVPKGVTINFYGPHGAALIDPNISEYFRRQANAKPIEGEVYTEGMECRNYLLSKYQGAHAGESGKETVETYKQIADSVRISDLNRTKHFASLMKAATLGQSDAKKIKMSMERIEATRGANVLTIRNRWNVVMGVPLKDAITEAKKAYPAMREFHCLFCRSYMLGDDPLPSQEVNYVYG